MLRDFYDDYALCLDEEDFDAWPTFFTDDALYRVISRENYDQELTHATMWCQGLPMIKDRIVATRQTALYEPRSLRHFISSVRINEVEGDQIKAQANFVIVESLAEREPQLLMVGRYIDTFIQEGDHFRIQQRSCVYDNYHIRTTLVIPV